MDRMKFPHLENLSGTGIAEVILRADFVTVTEKIDGFNARFGRGLDGECWVGTRNLEFDPDKESMQGFGQFGILMAAQLPPGVTIFGEWAGKGIQKRIDYGEPGFWFFDGHHGMTREMANGGNWFDPDDMAEYASEMRLRRPRQFYAGRPPTIEQLEGWRDTPGVEGVVIRAYPMAVDVYGHPLIAKFKSAVFSERASERARPHRAPVDLTNVQAFVEEYVTSERLGHVLAQVGESLRASESEWMDLSPLDARLTGDVLRAMYQDIVREGASGFEALSDADQKLVGKVSANETKVLLDAARNEAVKRAA